MLPAATETVKQELVTHFIPILESCGTRFLDAEMGVEEFLAVEFRGERIPFAYATLQDRSGDALRFFFTHFDDVKEIEDSLSDIPAPFHGDIASTVDARLGQRLDFHSARIITFYLAHRIRESGRRVWS